MDTDEHNGRIWNKISSFFSQKEENIEQAIIEAQEEGELKEEESSMLLSILELDSMQISEIMVPRTDMCCLPSDANIAQIAQSIVETGHSRFPIFEDTKDNIIGIIYAKDLIQSLVNVNKHEDSIHSLLKDAYFVPETKICSELLQEFRARKNHIAIVVDEYGGTSGLITIEDLLEVIVGEIEDEHDAPKELDIEQIQDFTYKLHGRAELEDLEDIGLKIESEEVDTLGGYLCLLAGRVPTKGEEFNIDEWYFTIDEADAKQVKIILAEKREIVETVLEDMEENL